MSKRRLTSCQLNYQNELLSNGRERSSRPFIFVKQKTQRPATMMLPACYQFVPMVRLTKVLFLRRYFTPFLLGRCCHDGWAYAESCHHDGNTFLAGMGVGHIEKLEDPANSFIPPHKQQCKKIPVFVSMCHIRYSFATNKVYALFGNRLYENHTGTRSGNM